MNTAVATMTASNRAPSTTIAIITDSVGNENYTSESLNRTPLGIVVDKFTISVISLKTEQVCRYIKTNNK